MTIAVKRTIFSLLTTLLLAANLPVTGQQVISSAGASATGSGVQLSWTVGEPVIATLSGGSHILTQGFHQSRLTVTALDPHLYPGLEVSVYPNPVSTSLKLDISGEVPGNISYRLYSPDGRMLLDKQPEALPELINMEMYVSGTYLLKVFRNADKAVGSFKIIRN